MHKPNGLSRVRLQILVQKVALHTIFLVPPGIVFCWSLEKKQKTIYSNEAHAMHSLAPCFVCSDKSNVRYIDACQRTLVVKSLRGNSSSYTDDAIRSEPSELSSFSSSSSTFLCTRTSLSDKEGARLKPGRPNVRRGDNKQKYVT